MSIEPRRPRTPFDLGEAMTQPFRSTDGRRFAWRLTFWLTGSLVLIYMVTMPFVWPHQGAIMEHSWLTWKAIFAGGPMPDSTASDAASLKTAPATIAMALASWFVFASAEVALHRKLLHGQEKPRRLLRFGKAELRLMVVQLGVCALVLFASLVLVFIVGFSVGMLSVSSALIAGIVAILGISLLLAVTVWLFVRLAPAGALTINQNKRHLLAANKVTKFRFWNLFLAYFVVGVFGYIGIYLVMALCFTVATGDPDFLMAQFGLGAENPLVAFEAAGERLKNPFYLILAFICLCAYNLAVSIWFLCFAGIGTYAVKWWSADDPMPHFD